MQAEVAVGGVCCRHAGTHLLQLASLVLERCYLAGLVAAAAALRLRRARRVDAGSRARDHGPVLLALCVERTCPAGELV